MGYWIHVDELPVGGGGGGSGPDWGGCLGCLGFLFVVFVLWGLHETYGLGNVLVAIISRGLLIGSVASIFGIFYILHEVEYEKPAVISGVAGFLAVFGLASMPAWAFFHRLSSPPLAPSLPCSFSATSFKPAKNRPRPPGRGAGPVSFFSLAPFALLPRASNGLQRMKTANQLWTSTPR